MLAYPANLLIETDGMTVTFPDVPEAITCGDDLEEALRHAVDALEAGLSTYIDRRLDLPRPSKPKRGQRIVTPTALGTAKLALYLEMRAQKVTKAALARRLGCHMPQVDRLLDLSHSSRLEQVETALAALGKRLVVELRDAA